MKLLQYAPILVVAMLIGAPASAQQYGTPAEAKTLLEKVATDMKANKAKTLQDITAGAFKEKDLYPFCGGPDGNFTAHGANASLVGQSMKDRKDPIGNAYGAEFYKVAQEGKFAQVSYMIPKPGETTPVAKESYITKIGDEVCGVGYYK